MGSAFDHSPSITVPSSSTNNRIVTWNGSTGKNFNNTALVEIAAGVVTGITSLSVDNIQILDNAIVSTNSNGNIGLTPNGSGAVVISKLQVTSSGAQDGYVLTSTDGNGNVAWEEAGGGKVLQAATAVFSGTQTITSDDNSFTDITNLSVNITPAATTSKILILVCIGKHDTHSDANTTQFIVYRGSHRLNTGNGAASTDTTVSNRIAASFTSGVTGQSNGNGNQHFSCLDSPSTTSQITYVVAASCHDQNVEINRWRTDSDNVDGPSARTASSITVLEVGA